METKYYEWNFYYDDVYIKNIVPVKSKTVYLPLCSIDHSKNRLNNEAYDFEWSIFEINLNETMETKIMGTNFIMMMYRYKILFHSDQK